MTGITTGKKGPKIMDKDLLNAHEARLKFRRAKTESKATPETHILLVTGKTQDQIYAMIDHQEDKDGRVGNRSVFDPDMFKGFLVEHGTEGVELEFKLKSPAPPLLGKKETVADGMKGFTIYLCGSCANFDACELAKGCAIRCRDFKRQHPKTIDHVATEPEKKETVTLEEFTETVMDMNRSVGNHDHPKQEVPEEKTKSLGMAVTDIYNMMMKLLARHGMLCNADQTCDTCGTNCNRRYTCCVWSPKTKPCIECLNYKETCSGKSSEFQRERRCFVSRAGESKPGTVKQEEERKNCENCGQNCHGSPDYVCVSWAPKPESEVKQMDFSNALKALKMGNKVKRVGWKLGFIGLAVFSNGHRMELIMGDFPIPYCPTVADLEATDWMLHIE